LRKKLTTLSLRAMYKVGNGPDELKVYLRSLRNRISKEPTCVFSLSIIN
jgi:hypothetical protein